MGLGTPIYVVKEQRINLKTKLENFINHHPIAKKKLQGAKKLFSQAALIPHGGLGKDEFKIVSKIYGNGYVIIGDAAGFVSPATGEGIYYGMKSGQLAAETIINSLEENDFSEKTMAEYYKKVLGSIIYGDMRAGWKIMKRFLESDKSTERLVRASKGDPWFGELTRKLISGEIPYPQFMRTLYTHPHKLIKALLFY